MKSNLLNEIKQLFENRGCLQNTIPIPSYLFVQRYGREIQEEMKEIAALFGQKEWFPFCCAGIKNEEKLLTGFKMALERHSGIGKEYAGSVLVEFSGMEEEKEIEELLDYIDRQKHRLHCIYTIKASEEVKDIKEKLENFGFVRVVQGEEYKHSEQIEIFQETINMYQFRLEEKAEDYIVDFFGKLKWQEEDVVKIRIQNMAKEIVYNRLMEGGHGEKFLKKEEVEYVLHSLQSGKMQQRQIGFLMEGVEV